MQDQPIPSDKFRFFTYTGRAHLPSPRVGGSSP
jgi:hypothetical protein